MTAEIAANLAEDRAVCVPNFFEESRVVEGRDVINDGYGVFLEAIFFVSRNKNMRRFPPIKI